MFKSLPLLEKIDKQIYWKKNVGDYPCFTLNELEKIKQDLEVLEIFKEFVYITKTDSIGIKTLYTYKNMDKYNKVKQWLLSNKVGDNHD